MGFKKLIKGKNMVEQKNWEELFDIFRSLSSTLELDTLLKRIGDAAEKLINAEASSIMLVDEDKQHLYFKTASGEKATAVKKIKIKIGEGIAGNVALTKKSEIVNDVTNDPRFTGKVDQESGFKTKSILAVPMMVSSGDNVELIGVAEVLNKKDGSNFTEEDKKLLESLAGLASVIILNAKFNENQRNFFANITEILVSAIESLRPRYIGKYWKMTQLATNIAKMLGINPKSEEYKNIYFATLLHDIGYLSTNLKTEMESADDVVQRAKIEQRHVIIGYELTQKINLLKPISIIIKHHHENYDGTGYPSCLKAEEIPLGSRIIAVVEYVEEIKMSATEKKEIPVLLKQQSGKRFDPKIVDITCEILNSGEIF